MSDFVLYRFNGACSLAPHIVLKELKLSFQSVVLGSSPNSSIRVVPELSSEEYRQIHPRGYVPALRVNGNTVLTESVAILSYLAWQRPQVGLQGNSSLEQAEVLSWLSFLSGSLHGQGFGMLFRPERFTDDETQLSNIRIKGRQRVEQDFELVEKRLGSGRFAVGNAPTVVDFFLIVFFQWGRSQDIDMSAYVTYEDLMRRMHEKESVRTTLEEEGLKAMF